MFEVNVMSGVRLTRHYLKGMLEEKKWGRVVFVSSEFAIFVPKEMVHYGFSKAAQLVIARGAAEMTKGTNVTVNSVLPGPTWVEMAPVRLAAAPRASARRPTTSPRAPSPSADRRRCCSATRRPRRSPTSSATSAPRPPAPPTAPRSAPTAASSPIRSRMMLMWALAVAVIYFGSFLAIGIIARIAPAEVDGVDRAPTSPTFRRRQDPIAGSARSSFWAPGVRKVDLPLGALPPRQRASTTPSSMAMIAALGEERQRRLAGIAQQRRAALAPGSASARARSAPICRRRRGWR